MSSESSNPACLQELQSLNRIIETFNKIALTKRAKNIVTKSGYMYVAASLISELIVKINSGTHDVYAAKLEFLNIAVEKTKDFHFDANVEVLTLPLLSKQVKLTINEAELLSELITSVARNAHE